MTPTTFASLAFDRKKKQTRREKFLAEMARAGGAAVVHHAESGQYLAIRYTDRLIDAGAVSSVSSVGDSYDNALAETIVGLYKTEGIHHRGPWCHLKAVEFATLEWVDWFNHRRLLEPIGPSPPPEREPAYYRKQREWARAA